MGRDDAGHTEDEVRGWLDTYGGLTLPVTEHERLLAAIVRYGDYRFSHGQGVRMPASAWRALVRSVKRFIRNTRSGATS